MVSAPLACVCAQARRSGDIVLGSRSLSAVYGLAASSDGTKVFRYDRSTDTRETSITPGSARIPEADLHWGDGDDTGQFTLTIHLAPRRPAVAVEASSPPLPGTPVSSIASG